MLLIVDNYPYFSTLLHCNISLVLFGSVALYGRRERGQAPTLVPFRVLPQLNLREICVTEHYVIIFVGGGFIRPDESGFDESNPYRATVKLGLEAPFYNQKGHSKIKINPLFEAFSLNLQHLAWSDPLAPSNHAVSEYNPIPYL